MVGFKVTESMNWLCVLMIPAVLLGLSLLIELFVNLYYEKHE